MSNIEYTPGPEYSYYDIATGKKRKFGQEVEREISAFEETIQTEAEKLPDKEKEE